jgi:hypothetical protein
MTAAQPTQPTGYGRAASTYRRAGWDGVLPLDKGSKWPPPDGHTGYEGRWPTGQQILEWVTARRDANVALRLPQGVVGIDVDDYGSKKGADTLAELEARYGPLPATWSSTSRGDGPSRIHLFRCPEDLKLPGVPGTSIEAIQYHHRYCVVWPSVVEGRRYRWYTPDGQVTDRPPRISELAWLPDDWHRLERRPRPVIDNYVPRAVTGDWSKAVEKYHAEGVAGLGQPGGRHDAMLPVILTLVRLDHDGHPGATEALDDLRGRFIAAVGDRSSAAQAESEWQRMEDGAGDHVATTPSLRGTYEDLKRRDDPPKAPSAPVVALQADEEPPEDEEEVERSSWDYVNPDAYLDGSYQRPQPDFLRRHT